MADEKEANDERQESGPGDEKEKGKEVPEVSNPPAPPKPENTPDNEGRVTRDEFRGLVDSVTKLTETVASLTEKITDSTPLGSDSKPVKRPWTHIGSRVHDGN